MHFDLYWEIFGYIGTACVLISMLMTSVVKLRIVNMIGALISLIYAVVAGAAPVAVLNGALILIQLWQLFRLRRATLRAVDDLPTTERRQTYETDH